MADSAGSAASSPAARTGFPVAGAQRDFADAEALRHDRCEVVVNDVKRGEVHSVGRVSGRRDHKVDRVQRRLEQCDRNRGERMHGYPRGRQRLLCRRPGERGRARAGNRCARALGANVRLCDRNTIALQRTGFLFDGAVSF